MKRLLTALGVLTCSVLLSAQERVTLLFVGDLMQHSGQIEAARTADGGYDYRECFSLVKDLIAGADIAVGNLEVTLGGKPYTGYPTFSAPDEYLHALADAGFDVLLTANNHSLDRGRRGLERTLMMLDSLGLHHTGTYRDDSERRRRTPLVVDVKGFRIAFLNYTYGTNGIRATHPNVVDYTDKDVIRQDIARARALRPDAIIACMHWGDEYQSLPNARQKELAAMIPLKHTESATGAGLSCVAAWNGVQRRSPCRDRAKATCTRWRCRRGWIRRRPERRCGDGGSRRSSSRGSRRDIRR